MAVFRQTLNSTDVLDAMFSVLMKSPDDAFLDHYVAAYSAHEAARGKLMGLIERAYTTDTKFGGMLCAHMLRKLGDEGEFGEMARILYKSAAESRKVELRERIIGDLEVGIISG